MHNWKAKKLLALLLSIVMVLGLLPMSALAADTTETAAAPITVTAGGKACTLEKLEDETYTIYRAVFYPEQDITIAPAGSTGTVSLFGPSGSVPIDDADGNPMKNLSSATLPAAMIRSNALPDDQITALPGYKELPGGHIAYSYIIVSVNDDAPFALHLAVVEQPAVVPVTSVTLSSTELTLTVGNTATLTATVGPEDATDKTVTWSVNSDAVTVDNGTVTAVKAGEATITATCGGKSASCTVTVEAAPTEAEMEIKTPDDLVSFAAKVKAGNTTLKGILNADIDMTEVTDFVGIGTETNPYAGEFVGNDHTVTVNINITNGNFGTNYCTGLFAFVSGAKIHDVILKGYVYSSNSVGLVGRVASGDAETKVENCTNEATLVSGNGPLGGIVGRADGKVTVLSCVNNGTLGDTTWTGSDHGGIAGKLSGAESRIEGCANHGKLIMPAVGSGTNNVGGIVGTVSAKNCTVIRCFNDANAIGSNKVGGIVGEAYDGLTVESCYNTGNITAQYTNSGQQGVAGILGTAAYQNNVVIKNVYNVGKIFDFGSGSIAAGAGGIVGYVNRPSSITNAYNAGTVSVKGTTKHGSILGYSLKNDCTISNCYWLTGTDEKMYSGTKVALPGTDTPASTSDALKALYTGLGDGFKQDAGNVNSGYPVLDWQESVGEPEIVSIKITHAPYKTNYTAGESFNKAGMTVAAVYDNDTEAAITDFTVEGGESLTPDVTKVTVKSGSCSAEQPITVLPASSAYELRVLTFEDADYKGGTNFAGGTDWSSLIDDPQYGGKLLYGESGAGVDSEEKAYTWTDTDNTELTSMLCHGYGSWCYWSGGHAVSNYATGDIADYGGYTTQLTIYKKGVSGLTRTGGGHNGSDNFAVHYGYMDGSQYNMTEVLPSISFADGVSHVIDSMYVTTTTYLLNCCIDGNSLTAKIGPDDWVKLVATGYDDAGVKTGETSIYLCNGPDDIVMDWTKFDLSVLGKVAKVEFNVTGSSNNGYGFSQPAYFAYDDVVVRFEKPVPAASVTFDKSELSLTEGDTAKLTATVLPAETTDTLTWSTSNDKVATVKDGTVTAVAAGTATITATCGKFKAECTVTVKAPAAAPISVKVDETAYTVREIADGKYHVAIPYGSDATINVTGASFLMVTDAKSNYLNEAGTNPFTLTAAELNGTVLTDAKFTELAPGFTPANYSKIAYLSIMDTMAGASYDLFLELTRDETPATSVTLDQQTLTLKPTQKAKLTATVEPADTTDTLVWSSSNEAVATVKDGTVTALKEGTATITATCGSVKAECVVTVEAPIEATSVTLDKTALNLYVGDTAKLTATVRPEDTTVKTIVWTSSDDSVTVNDGVVTAAKAGTATVTAACGSVKAECTVTVNAVTEPTATDGVYQIGTVSELVWFAKQVNGGNSAIKGVLTGDIDLNGLNWTPIGTSSKKFAGSFDGAGHTIKNLSIDYATAKSSERVYLGLFGNVEGAKDTYAVIKDLTVEGSVRAASSYSVYTGSVGGVIGNGKSLTLTGVIARVTVTADTNVGKVCSVGGLAGTLLNCTMANCGNECAVSGVQNVGGLVGWFYGDTMTGCYNTGSVTGTALGVGGITGYAKKAAITNVYNTGAASTTKNQVGGLIGVMENSTLTNAYSTGKITVSETGGDAVGAAVGWAETLSNVFYLEGTAATGVGKGGTAEVKTAAELKGLAATLGEGFKNDAGNVNSGYPVLDWQESVGEPEIVSIKITHAPYKTNYTAGESFNKAGMTVAAVYDNDTTKPVDDFTVENGENLTAGTASVTVKSGAFTAAQPITVLPASSAYELRVLTFEDADYKGDTNFAGGNDWTSLIDNPQYGGKLLYPDGSGTTDVNKAYTWTDLNNTELTHTLPKSWDNYCYWGGGHAISHYNSSDFVAHGDFNHQLTVYNKNASAGVDVTGGGHNGSDNFAVHFGYKDNSGYTDSQILPSFSFVDAVERVVDHMYVNNITYALNCYLNGNGLTAKIGPDDWVKLTATGYNAAGEKTGDASIYLCNGPEHIITDWTKFDLSGLGKVLKVEFNITGSSDNGHGFSQPAYFAYDDVAVRFEKTPTTGLLGDVNNDGDITLGDAVLLYAYVRGKTDLTADQLSRCDLNNDGTVSLGDAVLLYAYVRGKITSFTQN